MGLGELLTKLFEPCRSAPKSPPCTSPKSEVEQRASANASDKTIVEVLPCSDVTNISREPGSPIPLSHAEGFAVHQVKKTDGLVRAKPDEEDDEPRQKLILDAFGFEVHRMLNSKAWDDRAQAIAAAKEKCIERSIPPSMESPVFSDACCKLVLVALQDKVMPIYLDGLDLSKFLFGDYFETFEGIHDVLTNNLEDLLPVIIHKTADRNARSSEATRATLTFLARCKIVGCSPVMAHIFSHITNSKDISAIRGRLELIDHMIAEFGFGKSTTITMQLVMGFVRPHLDATDEKVRRAAIEVTVNCYKHKGDRTLKYITNVKPALLKLLQQRFHELDKTTARGAKKGTKSRGLPEVRGKPRKHEAPMRELSSQPVPVSATVICAAPPGPVSLPDQYELNNVIKDCPVLFSHAGDTITSPMLSQAAVSTSFREDPNFVGSPTEMPGAVLGMPGVMPESGRFQPQQMNGTRMNDCLLYTSDAADDLLCVDLGGRRIIKKKKKDNRIVGVTKIIKQTI
eukprot:TRINITY_DN22149_c0_g1_i2.p1 TRINITY_DN22149_c0_g1~~TRINITY_DN22149_c0_g1_i2.p1  ORF type:complete len:513 (-),score=101.60 TRINITY_DN22149_c0_g1_i2:44-1582(-)